MKSTALKTVTLLPILLFCSCSNGSDSAEVPEMAPTVSQASKNAEIEPLPAQVLLNSKELFGSTKPDEPKFADDPLLQSADSFGELNTDESLKLEQTDFSQDLVR